jgi:SPP1 family predicted phage head-tail adaptor|tara:strand:- start:111 stop:479 length:369 start_codon:yes stop_codon:yes gene_type:complete
MKNKPKIGDLRHLVDIQNATDTTDDAGGFTQVYDTVTSVFASIKPKKGTEVYGEGSQGMQLENAITHEIFIRWRDDVTFNTSSRIIFNDRKGITRTFNVRSILNLEEKDRFFKISAEENVAV